MSTRLQVEGGAFRADIHRASVIFLHLQLSSRVAKTRQVYQCTGMFPFSEEARACVEQFLGWVMLLRLSSCCKAAVTSATWNRSADAVEATFPALVHHLLAGRVGPIMHLANKGPETVFPVFGRTHGGFLGPKDFKLVTCGQSTLSCKDFCQSWQLLVWCCCCCCCCCCGFWLPQEKNCCFAV